LQFWRGEPLGEGDQRDDQPGDGGAEDGAAGKDHGQQGRNLQGGARRGDEHGHADQAPFAEPTD